MELSSVEDLKVDLARTGFRPVYVVLGPEDYLARQAVALLKSSVVPPELRALNYSEFQAPEHSASDFLSVANTFPMMSAYRMVLVEDSDKLEEADRDRVLRYLDQPAKKAVLVLVASDLDRRMVFYRKLRERSCFLEFPRVKGAALERWAADYVRRRGHSMSAASLKKLVDAAGTDLESLSNEVEKLLLYAGEARQIPETAVDDLVQASRQHGIFELTGAVGLRDKPLALKLLANMLDTGEHPLVVTMMMARHFRQILIAHETLGRGGSTREVGSAAQVPGFALDGFLRQVKLIDRDTAARMYLRLAGLDYRFKSSSTDPRVLLEHLICSL